VLAKPVRQLTGAELKWRLEDFPIATMPEDEKAKESEGDKRVREYEACKQAVLAKPVGELTGAEMKWRLEDFPIATMPAKGKKRVREYTLDVACAYKQAVLAKPVGELTGAEMEWRLEDFPIATMPADEKAILEALSSKCDCTGCAYPHCDVCHGCSRSLCTSHLPSCGHAPCWNDLDGRDVECGES